MNIRKAVNLLAVALCLAAWTGFAGARQDFPKEKRTPEFSITFEVSFAKGAPRDLTHTIYFPRRPDDPPKKWTDVHTTVSFVHWTRALGSVKGDCGTPFMTKDYLDLGVPDGEWRKVEVRGHKGFVSYYIELGGRMQRTLTVQPSGAFALCGMKIDAADGVTVRNVAVAPFDPATMLPKAARDGFETAETPRTVEIPVADGAARFAFVPGDYPVSVSARFVDGSTNVPRVAFTSFSQDFNLKLYNAEKHDKDGNALFEKAHVAGWKRVPDSGMRFSGCGQKIDLYTIPRMAGRYGGVAIYGMLTNLAAYGECASRHAFELELVRRGRDNLLWVDGNYIGRLSSGEAVRSVALRLPAGAMWRVGEKVKGEQRNEDPLIEKIAFAKPFDTSVCIQGLGSHALECDGYLSRESTDALPESCLRRVPVGTYLGARVRCRLGGDTNRNTVLTARLTNFRSPHTAGRSIESVTQEKKTLPRDLKGETTVEFRFDPGQIQDVIWQRGFNALDFEVLGDCCTRHAYFDQSYLKPKGKSDVIVTGAELIRAPAGMCVENGRYGNLYAPGETPSFDVTAEAVVAGDFAIDWVVRDIAGAVIETKRDALSLKAGERRKLARDFAAREPGWYGVTATLKDAKGAALVVRKAAFVELAADTRKAGYESPFFTWSGLGTRREGAGKGDRARFERVMELMHRLGFRHAQMGDFGEKDGEKWGVTLSPIPRIPFSAKKTPAEREREYEAEIDRWMARFPHASAATIFHENYCKTRRGQKPDAAADAEEVRMGAELCRVWRRKFPQVRLVLGNSGDSIDKIDQLFRAGFPKDLIDTMGEESVGGSIPPETAVGAHFLNLRDLALEYGYDKVMPEGCYEWKSRQERNFDSPRLVAAFIVRDALIALAWGSRNITLEGSPEPDSSYFTTSWGGGIFSHLPLMTPYPSAAAVATVTRVMDRVRFTRLVPTGSETVHCLEFTDPDGRWIYALWSEHGALDATVEGGARKLVETTLYGAERVHGATVKVRVSEEPLYLVSEKPVKSLVLAKGDRDYAFERYAGLERVRTLATMDNTNDWALAKSPYPCTEKKVGGHTLAVAEDPAKGRCLRLTRPATDEGRSFGAIRAKKGVPVPADAKTIGVWVKGNSSRGKIHFEVEDARGYGFVAASWTYDWGNKLGLDFDGWRLVAMPVSADSPVRIQTPGGDSWGGTWRCLKGYSIKEPVYPLKFKGIGFCYSDTVVNVRERHAVADPSVSVGDVVCW